MARGGVRSLAKCQMLRWGEFCVCGVGQAVKHPTLPAEGERALNVRPASSEARQIRVEDGKGNWFSFGSGSAFCLVATPPPRVRAMPGSPPGNPKLFPNFRWQGLAVLSGRPPPFGGCPFGAGLSDSFPLLLDKPDLTRRTCGAEGPSSVSLPNYSLVFPQGVRPCLCCGWVWVGLLQRHFLSQHLAG